MATLKYKDLKKLTKGEREKKLKELRLELVKSKTSASKVGTANIKKARRAIARLIMINESNKEELKHK